MQEKFKSLLLSVSENESRFSINNVQNVLEIGFVRAMKLKEILIERKVIDTLGKVILSTSELEILDIDEIFNKLYDL